MSARWFFALLGLVNGCAETPRAPRLDASPARPGVAAAQHALTAPQPPSAAPSFEAHPPEQATAVPKLQLELRQELTVRVSSIALGEGSRIAVLADPPYVGDARGLHALPLPSSFRPKSAENDELGIFWGRDNEPRIMGTRRSSAGETPVYLRHTSAGWRDGRDEVGQLGSATRGGLWGVLGSWTPSSCVARALSASSSARAAGRSPQPGRRRASSSFETALCGGSTRRASPRSTPTAGRSRCPHRLGPSPKFSGRSRVKPGLAQTASCFTTSAARGLRRARPSRDRPRFGVCARIRFGSSARVASRTSMAVFGELRLACLRCAPFRVVATLTCGLPAILAFSG